MGVYVNSGNKNYKTLLRNDIFVDKSLLILNTIHNLNQSDRFICVCKPRHFGKTTDVNMLVAYYSKGCDSHDIFDHLKISQFELYKKHLNKHNVIYLNIQEFLSSSQSVHELINNINRKVINELKNEYDKYCDETYLSDVLYNIFINTKNKFIIIIDEWDYVMRKFKNDNVSQKQYSDYLRLLLKDKPYVELCYMTGILPIKKFGIQGGLNMFDEISMIQPESYSEFMGFSEDEVKELCKKYEVDFSQMKETYNGYHLTNDISIYSPRSVSASIQSKEFNNYWSQTTIEGSVCGETLQDYIELDFEGLKDDIIAMIINEKRDINIRTFQNDMSTFHSKDDVFTLLVHLGYLGYDTNEGKVYIPNNEVKESFKMYLRTEKSIVL